MHAYMVFLYKYVWILLKCVVGLTITLDCYLTFFLVCEASLLMCSLLNSVLSQVSNGHTRLTPCVLEPLMHLPWLTAYVTPLLPKGTSYLPLRTIVVKPIPYDPLLGLLHQTIWGLGGTSYWRDPLTCWRVQHHQHNLILTTWKPYSHKESNDYKYQLIVPMIPI